ncbi:uncharacterized protein LOC135133272 isoform X10 [Zophobas morio]|uniref:uncharacterized protein LOC135133272 isoform X10 n=1 Tax=Zophobas morio TaxID=2755281 RepID=UPI0030837B24
MATLSSRSMTKSTRLVEKFCATEIDRDLKKTLIELWSRNTDDKHIFPVFSEWLVKAVGVWGTPGATPETHSISFALNLAALLCKNEDKFNELNSHNFFLKLIKATKARESKVTKIKMAYVRLLGAFLDHEAGILWMTGSNLWEDVLSLCLASRDGVIVDECTRFVRKMLERTLVHDENFCGGVINRIMFPLGENIYSCIKGSEDVSDDVATERLQPTLKLTANVLEELLKGVQLEGKDYGLLFLFLKNFHTEGRICDFMMIAQKRPLLFDLSKIVFIMQFLELYAEVITNTTTMAKVAASIAKIRSNFLQNFLKASVPETIEFISFGLLYWNLVETKLPSFDNDNAPLSKYLTVSMFMPNLCFVIKYLTKRSDLEEELVNDNIRANFFGQMMKTAPCDVKKIFGAWHQRISYVDSVDVICRRCCGVIKNSRNLFSRDQAAIVFRFLIYFLSDIVRITTENPAKVDFVVHQASYVGETFKLVGVLVDDFDFVLKDGFEVTYVMGLCFDFLGITEWSSEVVVEVMKLANIATVHYMAPNMALLVEETPDLTINRLGPLLCSKTLHDCAEVRKAALEVACTSAAISSNKFPSLQKVLMDSELPTLVVKMSTCDGESFVRATAIKCLQEMIQVEEIWNNALKTEDLSQKMRDILLNETEGIVRVEAATFMCVAYEHQQFPKDSLDAIYETMIYSSTTDLHWEVKVRALNFWDKVIKNHLQNQGMIDGSFPNVTFSKEHRKIVTLTDSEIRKRLLKVLGQLSAIGCLGVLTAAIKDDCDMEVSKTAVKITQKLVDLLKKYAVGGECSGPTSPIPTESGMSMSSGISVDESMDSPRSSQPDLNEEIIEQIVNAKDASLLKGVYAPSDYGSVSNYDFQVRKIVTPTEFLQFTHQDLNNIIAEKKKWLNGIEDLGSLLDDMLKTYDEDVNSMDCY